MKSERRSAQLFAPTSYCHLRQPMWQQWGKRFDQKISLQSAVNRTKCTLLTLINTRKPLESLWKAPLEKVCRTSRAFFGKWSCSPLDSPAGFDSEQVKKFSHSEQWESGANTQTRIVWCSVAILNYAQCLMRVFAVSVQVPAALSLQLERSREHSALFWTNFPSENVCACLVVGFREAKKLFVN